MPTDRIAGWPVSFREAYYGSPSREPCLGGAFSLPLLMPSSPAVGGHIAKLLASFDTVKLLLRILVVRTPIFLLPWELRYVAPRIDLFLGTASWLLIIALLAATLCEMFS